MVENVQEWGRMNSVYNLHIALSPAHKIFYEAMEIAALLPKQAFNKPA